jgi:hypothetical protein
MRYYIASSLHQTVAHFAMIEKLEFYHGAAIIRIIEDVRCRSVGKNDYGYLVNGDRSVLLKYCTKPQSPWRFTVTSDDLARFDTALRHFETCVLALVCGGDGVCAVPWRTLRQLVGSTPGWIAAKRAFSGCYSVSGPAGILKKKVALNQWPSIVFEQERIE